MLKEIQEGKITPFESTDEPTIIVGNKTADSREYNDTKWDTYA
jgi:hypothetical protein